MELTSLIIVASVHILAGMAGTLLINSHSSPESSRENLIKFTSYFIIYAAIVASAFFNRALFMAVWIIIASGGLIEILLAYQNGDVIRVNDRTFFTAIGIFSVAAGAFSCFVLLPREIIIFTYSVVVFFDGSSQIAGKIAGRHKILPSISPAKTIEGTAGGVISALISAYFIRDIAGLDVSRALLYALAICIAAFTGDMVASAYKRACKVKDFSNILPGQGGILDRFDSFIMAGAIAGISGLPFLMRTNAFSSDTALFLIFSLVNLSILLTCEISGKKFGIRPEYTRMASHILIGISSMIFLLRFSSPLYAIGFCLQSIAFTYITGAAGVLGSHHRVKRRTNGSTWFYAGILLAYASYLWKGNQGLFYIPVSILTISDPAASIAGIRRNSGFLPSFRVNAKPEKTYAGSVTFFITAFLISLAGCRLFFHTGLMHSIFIAFTLALLTATTEAVSSKGTDNLTIPAVASAVLLMAYYFIISQI